ncbi:hypothetical protein IKR20_06240 [bacterium]|nr:hypothetical protein [bacterium]
MKNALELVTEVFNLDKSRLYVTVFREDDEAEQLWLCQKQSSARTIFSFSKCATRSPIRI